jgi:hypothetical protein
MVLRFGSAQADFKAVIPASCVLSKEQEWISSLYFSVRGLIGHALHSVCGKRDQNLFSSFTGQPSVVTLFRQDDRHPGMDRLHELTWLSSDYCAGRNHSSVAGKVSRRINRADYQIAISVLSYNFLAP